MRQVDYHNNEGTPATVASYLVKEITASSSQLGGYFFLFSLMYSISNSIKVARAISSASVIRITSRLREA